MYNSVLSLIGIVGLGTGALTGGRVCALFGFRKSLLASNIINLLANILKVSNLSIPTLIIGRFLFGFGSGILTFGFGKAINETIPIHIM